MIQEMYLSHQVFDALLGKKKQTAENGERKEKKKKGKETNNDPRECKYKEESDKGLKESC